MTSPVNMPVTATDRFEPLLGAGRGAARGADSATAGETLAAESLPEFYSAFFTGRAAKWAALESEPQPDGRTTLTMREHVHAVRAPNGSVLVTPATDGVILRDLNALKRQHDASLVVVASL